MNFVAIHASSVLFVKYISNTVYFDKVLSTFFQEIEINCQINETIVFLGDRFFLLLFVCFFFE